MRVRVRACVTFRDARDAVYMDQAEDCGQVLTQPQDLVEGDLFLVKSDVHGGKVASESDQQPAECAVTFNFGSRRLSVSVVDWTCEENYTEPVLTMYADCDGLRTSKPLVRSILPHIRSPCTDNTSCLTFFNLPRRATATATTATASRLRSQKLHIVLWGLHVGLVL